MFLYVAISRPFKDRPLNLLNILVEFFITSSYFIMISFYFDLNDEQENAMKWLGFTSVICALSVTVGYILFTFGVSIMHIFRKKTEEDEKKPEPETTTNKPQTNDFEAEVNNEEIELVYNLTPSQKRSMSEDLMDED
jgi:hypothetical protein